MTGADLHGADMSDEGKRIEVTLHGDDAYTRGVGLPVAISLLAIAMMASAVFIFRKVRQSAGATT